MKITTKPLCVLFALPLTALACNRPSAETSNAPRTTKAIVFPASSTSMANIAISRANFYSLEFDTKLGTVKRISRARMRVENGRLTVSTPEHNQHLAPFSRAEFDELLKILNTAKFPALSGNFIQPRLFDGVHETVTLTLRVNDEKPLVFTVNNYGNRAPRGYKSLCRSLYHLRARKFPSENFESVNG